MRATTLTALAAAILLTLPRALDEPVSAVALGIALLAALVGVLRGPVGLAKAAAPVAAVLWLQVAFFPLPTGQWMFGLVLGAMASLVALGMALIYRANRVLNFAQAELGTAPAVLVVGLVTVWGWSWWLSVPLGLLAAIVLGAVVELAIIRRFTRSPRLILTVATIGLSQLLTFVSILLPRLFDVNLLDESLNIPWDVRISDGPPALTGDHVLALIAVPAIIGALAAFIRFTDVGVAIRAASESTDRAALLGIPVRRLQTTVWVLATVLSFVGVLLRAGVVALPVASTLSFGILLTALAALVLGDFTDLVAVAAAATAIGILEQGVLYNSPDELVAPVVGGVIIVAMLVRRAHAFGWVAGAGLLAGAIELALGQPLDDLTAPILAGIVVVVMFASTMGTSRVEDDDTTAWRTAEEVRPIPAELRGLPEIRAARWGLLAVAVVGIAAFAAWGAPSNHLKGAFLACFVLVAASVVVLTGWSGQVSLGQMSFVAVGAAVGAKAVGEWSWDVSLALLAAAAAAAVVAVIVGIPALRLRGPLLGVTTLAFAVASTQYLLNRSRNSMIPRGAITESRLFAYFDLADVRTLFVVTVVVAAGGLLLVRGIRTSRSGRVLLAQRDNERAAASYGISVTRAKLTAFAVSGAMAGAAGCLYVQGLRQFGEQPFEPAVSFNVFTASVVGGLGSLTGAVIGALFLNGGRWFLPADWQLLPSALGVLLVLMILPGGLGELVFRGRDAILRRIADRRGLVVPSLVADVRTDDLEHDVHALTTATEHAEEVA